MREAASSTVAAVAACPQEASLPLRFSLCQVRSGKSSLCCNRGDAELFPNTEENDIPMLLTNGGSAKSEESSACFSTPALTAH